MLRAQVEAALASTRPGGAAAAPTVLDALRRRTDAASPTHSDGVRRAAAVILAQARRGSLAAALAVAERALSAVADEPAVPPTDLGDLSAAAAEAYATAGQPWQCVALARRALEYADDDGAVFRGHAFLAIGHALNGEYDAAAAAVGECERLASANGWAPSAAFYPLLLGRILLASARLNAASLEEIAVTLGEVAPDDVVWRTTRTAAEGMALLTRGDAGRAIPLLLAVANSTEQLETLMMIRGFTLGLYADLLLGRGQPRRVLTLLEGRESPRGHAICFDMQRAAAYLLIGDPRRALVTTEGCVHLGTAHCLRTVPPILLRRAIAEDRLGHARLADESFEAGFHLVSASGSLTPMLTLPPAELSRLADRLEERRPDLSASVAAFRARLQVLPPVDLERAVLPRLTEREARLAARLRDSVTFAALAIELHVSLHTLKSQSRSLYAKLGVGSREEAVAVLERAGFFD